MSTVRVVKKVLAVEEDLLYGEGVVEQERAGKLYEVNRIRGFRPVNSLSELNVLDPSRFPKVALVQNGVVTLKQYNGTTYEDLAIGNTGAKASVTTEPIVSLGNLNMTTCIFSVPSPHTLTTIAPGSTGQELTLVSTTNNTTVANNSTISLKSGQGVTIPRNTGLKLIYTGSTWAEV